MDGLQAEHFREVRAPRSWRLHRQTVDGAREHVADSVATFDLTPQGEVLYSDGVDICLWRSPGQVKSVARDVGVQQVLWLE